MKGYVFIKNTVILTATAFAVRAIGMIFKVWTSARVGAEVMGLYSLVISVYVLVSTYATSGICTGVTRLISENAALSKKGISDILKKSALLVTAAGLLLGGGTYILSDFIAVRLLDDGRVAFAIKIFCIAMPFKGLASCIRGYFFAVGKTSAPSVSQLFEQLIRIAAVVGVIYIMPFETPEGLMVALVIGDVASEITSFIYVYIAYLREKNKMSTMGSRQRGIFGKLIHIALPITGSKYVISGLHTAESMIVPRQLTLYTHSNKLSLEQFGMLKGMALPLIFFPSSFLSALSIMLLPEMSRAAAEGNGRKIKELTRRSVGTTLIASVLIAGIFFFRADELSMFIYNSAEVGKMIKILSVILPFMYIESIADGMLKGLDQQKSTFFYNTADSICRLTLIFLLVPHFGIYGFAAVMIISNITTSSLNTARLIKVTASGFDIKNWIIKPLLAAVLGGAAAYPVTVYIRGEAASLILSLSVQGLVSVGFLALSGGIPYDSLQKFIPKKYKNKKVKILLDK